MSQSGQPQKIRHDPRFGVNALMKYMVADALQRRRLILEQKYPPAYKVTWYEPACQVISRFIAGGMEDESILSGEMSRLASLVPGNDNEALKYALNVEALESFLNSYDEIQLNDLTPSLGQNITPNLNLSGIAISVRPDIVLQGNIRRSDVAGALKLYFSKRDQLAEEAARLGAAVVMLHSRSYLANGATVRPAYCSVFDVFAGRFYPAPTAITQRIHNLVPCQPGIDKFLGLLSNLGVFTRMLGRSSIMNKKFVVRLSVEERGKLEAIVAKGKAAARQLTRARILLKADCSPLGPAWSDEQIRGALDLGAMAVHRVRRALVEGVLMASSFVDPYRAVRDCSTGSRRPT